MKSEDGDTIQPVTFSLTTSAGQGSAGRFWLRVHRAVLVRWGAGDGMEGAGEAGDRRGIPLSARGLRWSVHADGRGFAGRRGCAVAEQGANTPIPTTSQLMPSGGSTASASLTSWTGLSGVPPKSRYIRNLRMSPYLE